MPDTPASNGWKPGFMTALMAKDVDLVMREAARAGVSASSADLVRPVLQAAVEAGYGREDFSALGKVVRAPLRTRLTLSRDAGAASGPIPTSSSESANAKPATARGAIDGPGGVRAGSKRIRTNPPARAGPGFEHRVGRLAIAGRTGTRMHRRRRAAHVVVASNAPLDPGPGTAPRVPAAVADDEPLRVGAGNVEHALRDGVVQQPERHSFGRTSATYPSPAPKRGLHSVAHPSVGRRDAVERERARGTRPSCPEVLADPAHGGAHRRELRGGRIEEGRAAAVPQPRRRRRRGA